MPKGEGLYPAPTKRVSDLDARLAEVQKGTRAAIPAMVPLHDILRQKFRWYYKWSTWPASKFINILILIVYLGGAGFFAYNFLRAPQKAVAATFTYNTANDNYTSGSTAAVTNPAGVLSGKATYGTTEANPPAGFEVTTANYTTMGTTDTSFYSTAGTLGVPPYQQFRYYVATSINLAQITNISANNVGYATVVNAPYRTFKIWNRNTTAWESLGTSNSSASPGDTITGSVNTTSVTYTDYVDPTTRYIYFEVIGNINIMFPGTIYTDKVDTTLTYNTPPAAPTITSPNTAVSWPLNSSANPVTWTGTMTNQVEAANLNLYDNFNDNSIDAAIWPTTTISSNSISLAETAVPAELKASGTAAGATGTVVARSGSMAAGNIAFSLKVKPVTMPNNASWVGYHLFNTAADRQLYLIYSGDSTGWRANYYNGTAWGTQIAAGSFGNETTEFKTAKVIVNNSIGRFYLYVYDADGTEHYIGTFAGDLTKGGTDNNFQMRIGASATVGSTIDARFEDAMATPVNSSLDENFDSYIDPNDPTGWTIVNEPTYGSVEVDSAQKVGATGNSVLLQHSISNGDLYTRKDFTALDGIVYAEADFRTDTVAQPYRDVRFNESGNNIKALIRFQSDTNLLVYNGVSGTAVRTYTNNTWYHILAVIDTQKQTYDVYIDGVLEADDFAVYSTAGNKTISRALLLSGGNVTATLNTWFDNVQAYSEFKSIIGLSASGTSQAWNTTGWTAGTKYLARARTLSGGLFGPYDYSDAAFTLYDVPATPSATAPSGAGIAINPTATSSAFSGSGSHTASSWEIYDNVGLGAANRVWYKTDDAANLTSIVVNTTNGTFENALVGLTALANNTNYWVRVRHKNLAGNSSWSAAVAFTTVAAVPPADPTNVTVDTITTTSALAHWTDNATDEDSYKVWVSTTSNATCSIAAYDASPTYTPAANSVSQALSSLTPAKSYCVKVAANKTSGGDSGYAFSSEFWTNPSTLNAPTVDGATSTSLTVKIDTTSNDSTAEYAISCELDTTFLNYTTNLCEAIVDNADHWRTYTNWGGASGFTDTGLDVNTSHIYKVKAHNMATPKVESVALSASTTEWTLADTPAAPTVANITGTATDRLNVVINSVTNPASTEFALGIDNDENGSIDASGWVQAVGTLGASAVWQDRTTWGGDLGKDVTGLSANTNYKFKVQARNGDTPPVETSLSPLGQKYTRIQVPVITIGVVTSTTIAMTGGTLSNIAVGSSGVWFEETSGLTGGGNLLGADGFAAWTTTNSITDNNLTASTTYSYKAKAQNGNGTPTAFSTPDVNQITNAGGTVPSAPTIGAPSAPSATSIRWTFTDNASDETGFKVYDSTDTLKATCAAPNLTYCDETGLSVNTQYTGRYVVAYNGNGNSAHSATAASIYTLANTPLAPTVNNPTATTLDVTINENSNPSNTTFAFGIDQNSDGSIDANGWVQANGTLGAGAVYQIKSTWGTPKTVTGLSVSTTYNFRMYAQNGDSATTAIGPIGSGATSSGLPAAPTIGAPSAPSATSIRWTFTDNASDETGFKVYDSTDTLKATCAAPNLTYCDETGLSVNTQYTGRYVVSYNGYGNSAHSGTAASIYTLANVPGNSTLTTLSTSSINVKLNKNGNPEGGTPETLPFFPTSDISLETTTIFPASPTTHFDKVDDNPHTSDTDYVAFGVAAGTRTDVFGISLAGISPTDTINSVKVIVTSRYGITSGAVAPVVLENGTTTIDNPYQSTTSSYQEYFKEWTTKPSTGTSWTYSDISSGFGVGLSLSIVPSTGVRATQVRVEITHTPSSSNTQYAYGIDQDNDGDVDTIAGGDPVNGWVQSATGALGASASWATYSTWGGASGKDVTGLAVNTNYRFIVAARNGDNAASNPVNNTPGQTKYTLANTPTAPTVNTTSDTSLTVIINQNSNPIGPAPAGDTQYAFGIDQNCATSCNGIDANGYVQANGTLGASAVWQTYSVWGGLSGKENTGLTAYTTYYYRVAARNGDSVETAYGSSGNNYPAEHYVWDGGGGPTDYNWSTAANWTYNEALVPGATPKFTDLSSKASTIDAGFSGTVAALNITSTWVGTITASRDLTVSGNLTLAGGILAGGTQTINVGGNWNSTGGVFTKNTSTINFNGSASSQTLTSAGQIFNNLTNKNTNAAGLIISGNLSVSGNLLLVADGTSNVVFDASTNNPNIIVGGDLDFTGAGAGTESVLMGNGTWTVSGNVNLTDGTITAGQSTLMMDGVTKILTLSSPVIPALYNLTISGTVSQSNNLDLSHNLAVSGTYTLGGYISVADSGAADITGGTLAGGSTLFLGDGVTLSAAGTVNAPVYFELNTPATPTTMPARTYGSNVTVEQNSGAAGISLTMAAGTHNISGGLYLREQSNQIITLNGASQNPTVNITGDLDYTGTGSGSEALSMGSGIWSVGGSVDFRNGALTAGSSTLKMTSTSAGKNIYNNSQLLNNLSFDGVGGGWTLQDSSANVDGNFNLTNGTLLANGFDISVAGNWANTGTFTAGLGQVVLDGGNLSTQIISGTTTFNNLVANSTANTAGRTLKFAGNSTTTVGGTWTVAGAAGKIITLQSSDLNSWTVNPTAASVSYADVSRSTNTGVTFCATFSSDSLNNTNWQISSTASCVAGTPTGLTGTALSATSIRWDWTDNADNESAYNIKDASHNIIPINPPLGVNATTWTEINLSINTSYTRYVEVTAPAGSIEAGPVSKYTLANTPLAPTVTTQSWNVSDGNALAAVTNVNSNPAWTEFAISCNTGGTSWLDASDGGCDATATDDVNHWKTKTNWETGTTNYLKNLTADTNYTIISLARNGDKRETWNSPGSTTMTAPAQPIALGHTTNTTSTITWNMNDNTVTPTGYQLLDATDTPIETSVTSDFVQNQYDANPAHTLAINTQYTVKTRAYRGAITGQPSATDSAYTSIETPTGITATAVSTTEIDLTATGTLSNLTSGSSKIKFGETSGNSGGGGEACFTAGDNTNSCADTGLSANTLYTYTATARNGDGEATSVFIQQTRYSGIQNPLGANGLVTPASIELNIGNVLSNLAVGTSAVQFEEISPAPSPGAGLQVGFWNAIDPANRWTKNTTVVDTGIQAGGTNVYRYCARARNADSSFVSGCIPLADIAPPQGELLLIKLPGQSWSTVPDAFGNQIITVTGTPTLQTAGTEFDVELYAVKSVQSSQYQDPNYANTITLTCPTCAPSSTTMPPPKPMSGGFVQFNTVGQRVSITDAGIQAITGTGSGGSSDEFEVNPGITSASVSTVSASPSSLNTGSTSTITVTLKDAYGNAISGNNVTVSSNQAGDVFTNNGATTNSNGVATIYLSSGLAYTSILTATDTTDSVTLNSNPQVTFTYTPPSATSVDNPANFTGTAGNQSTNLSWTNPASFDHIHIYRSTSEGDLGNQIADNITSTSYTDNNLTNGTIYYYTLKSSDSSGNLSSGTYQLALTPTGASDNQAPTAPSNLRATKITSSEISLRWDASTDNVGVVGYRIYNANTGIQIGATVETNIDLTELSPETTYSFFVKAYDAAGNLSPASNSLQVTTLALAPGEVTPGEGYICRKGGGRVAYLILGNVPSEINAGQKFKDNVNVKAIAADRGGGFCEDYRGLVYFDSTDKKADLLFNKSNPYTFSQADSGVHEFKGSNFKLNTVGDQELSITDNYATGKAEVRVLGGVVYQKAQDYIKKNSSKVNTAVITTTTALLLTPVLVNVAIGLGNIIPQLLYWFSQLMQLIGIRKRRKPWGLVFNSQSGQPVGLAVVRIFDKEYNRLLETAVTDREGRFGFLVKPGTFYIKVQKSGFSYPSMYKVSEFFENAYTGGNFEVKGQNESVSYNIPLDPQTKVSVSFSLLVILVKLNKFLQKIRIPLLIIGTIFAVIMIITSYHILYVLSLVLYGFLGIIDLLRTKKARPYGIITDVFGHPLQMAMVRIYEKKKNRMVATDVSDAQGRFRFLVNPGIFYITATKPGYIDFKSHIMYLEKERTLVTTNIKLKKVEGK